MKVYKAEDIRNAMLDLNHKVFLEKHTAEYILNAIRDLQPIEVSEELEQKAKDCEYYRGRVEGLEYVIDTLENILKSKGEE